MSKISFSQQPDLTWAPVGADHQPVSTKRYRAISPFHDGFAVVIRLNDTPTLIDETGHEVPLHGLRFSWILPMQSGRAPARTIDGELGYIDRRGMFYADNHDPEWAARKELTRISHLIYERGYNVSLDGNISWRLDDGNLLISPSGAHLGFITPDKFVVVSPDGALLRGERQPTSEYALHVELHQRRPECRCVIHAHCPITIAASLAGVNMHETFITIAPVPTTAYGRPASEQSVNVIQPYIDNYNWAILPRHGAVVWAKTAWEAFLRVESLEHYAKILMAASSVGPLEPLPTEHRIELMKIWETRNVYGGPDSPAESDIDRT